jgi:hypothetical protein
MGGRSKEASWPRAGRSYLGRNASESQPWKTGKLKFSEKPASGRGDFFLGMLAVGFSDRQHPKPFLCEALECDQVIID